MSSKRGLILVIIAAALLGCQSNQITKKNLTFGATKYSRIYQASLAVLQNHKFTLDITDYRYGKITTHRTMSPTIIEPWKNQNGSLGMALDSTAGELARKVIVSLLPINADTKKTAPDKNRSYKLNVDVIIYNKQYPTRRIIGAASGYVFNTLSTVPLNMKRRGITKTYWLKIGHDKLLAKKLTKEILHKAGNIKNTLKTNTNH